MRYLTNKLIKSWNFHNFGGDNYQEDMDGYTSAFSARDDLCEDEKYSIFLQSYKDWIQYRYKKGIYKEDLVRQIIFDKNGELKPLEETIYLELGKLKFEYSKIFIAQFDKVREKANVIKNGKYPNALKSLANLDKHDAQVSFEKIEGNKLQILYKGYDTLIQSELYTLKLCEEQDLSFLDIISELKVDLYVLYEELLVCEGNFFEYNILLTNFAPNTDEHLEITILFSKVGLKILKPKDTGERGKGHK